MELVAFVGLIAAAGALIKSYFDGRNVARGIEGLQKQLTVVNDRLAACEDDREQLWNRIAPGEKK